AFLRFDAVKKGIGMKRTGLVSSSLAAVLAGALFASGPVSAQKGGDKPKGGDAPAAPKYRREGGARVTVQVKRTELTRGLQEKKKGKSEFVPEVSAEEFINIQGQQKIIRGQEIAEYRRLIEETEKDDPELPDLLFRLAEKYAQMQRYWRFRAGELYGKIAKAKSSAKQQLVNKQKQYLAEEGKYLTQAIKIYALIANNPKFKNYARMDEALFYYAYTLQGAKRVDLSRKVYHQLIQNYPNSKFIPFAYLALADYFFETNNLAQAEKFYDKVLEFPDSPV